MNMRHVLLLSSVLAALLLAGCPTPTTCGGGKVGVSVTDAGSFIGKDFYAAIYESGADPVADPYLGWMGGDEITTAVQFIAYFKDAGSNPVELDKGTYDVWCFIDDNENVNPAMPSPDTGDYSNPFAIAVTVSCGDATLTINVATQLTEMM